MKMNTQGGPQNRQQPGSFGLPPNMKQAVQDAHEKKRAEQEEQQESSQKDPPGTEQQEVFNTEKSAAEKATEEVTAATKKNMDPRKILDELGVSFTDEDFQHLVFRGYLEKDVVITKIGKQDFVAKLKTLTTKEYGLAADLLMEEVGYRRMLDDDFRAKKSLWTICFGVTQLQERAVTKPQKTGDGKQDIKKEASERRKVFDELAPAVVDLLIQKHWAFSTAVSAIVANPEEYSKNS